MNDLELKWYEAKKKLIDLVDSQKLDLKDIAVSFSGGKDSTVVLKLIEEVGWKNKVKVVFFNTLMEYEVIYKFINKKRSEGWIIDETKPKMPAPLIYKKYGIPFKSKETSNKLWLMQQKNFDFINDGRKSLEELKEKYKGILAPLKWWCGKHNNPSCKIPNWLKEELITNGLNFKVADKCCEYLKKKPVYEYNKLNKVKLSIIGIRQAEGGARKQIYKGCTFFDKKHKQIKYFPLFWFSEKDMEDIIKWKNIDLCEAYTKYGLTRTGCVGCPYSMNCKSELEDVVKVYEPNKYIACMNLFKDSYELKEKKNYKGKENEHNNN